MPVQVTGEVFPGGLLDQQLVQVAVEAEATNIPQGDRGRRGGHGDRRAGARGDLTLPAGVTLVTEPEALVLHVLAAPTAEQIEAELGEVPAAEAAEEVPPAPEEAAAGAPAAEGQAQSCRVVWLRFTGGRAGCADGLPRRKGRTG